MKTKTILSILLVIAALTLTTTTLLPKQVHSIQGSYMYASLSYGRGWMPWTCVVEQGLNAEDMKWNDVSQWFPGYSNYITNFTDGNYIDFEPRFNRGLPKCADMRVCPFEETVMWGDFPCNSDSSIAPAWGMLAEITIPEDIKLVTRDGYVVKDEICAGDKFKFSKGVEKGEWWQRGGHEDSPPIYWVDDVEKLVLDIMDYHDKTITTREDLCSNPSAVPDGYIDEVAGIPVYTVTVPLGDSSKPNLTGNMVCSIKEKRLNVMGAAESAGYYEATSQDITFNTDSVVECMYYYFGGSGGYLRFGHGAVV